MQRSEYARERLRLILKPSRRRYLQYGFSRPSRYRGMSTRSIGPQVLASPWPIPKLEPLPPPPFRPMAERPAMPLATPKKQREPKPVRRDIAGNGRLDCCTCLNTLPAGWFRRIGVYSDGLPKRCSQCRDCEQGRKAFNNQKRLDAGVPKWRNAGEVRRLLKLQGGRCAGCRNLLARRMNGRTGYHIDHIKPIAKGGRHDDGNIQLLCPRCNLRKGTKDQTAFMRSHGRLL